MTTLAADTLREWELGDLEQYPAAVDIIYEGAAVGINSSGNAEPLGTGANLEFAGFCTRKVDNSGGSAGDLNATVRARGRIKLAVTTVSKADIGRPVFATDDNAFTLTPVSAVAYIGKIARWISTSYSIVEIDTLSRGPLNVIGRDVEALAAATKTLDSQDSGKIFYCTTTTVVTLPSTAAGLTFTLANGGAFGAVQISADPASADKIMGSDITAEDNKDLINTLATAKPWDYVVLLGDGTLGYTIQDIQGTWAREA